MKDTPQLFNRGDLVHIAKDLGPHKPSHTAGVDAIVLGSYGNLCRGKILGDVGDDVIYSVFIEGKGSESWFHQSELTLIKKGCGRKLISWAKKLEKINKKKDEQWRKARLTTFQ